MRRAVVKLGQLSAMATSTGAVRHSSVAVGGAKRLDAPAGLRCPPGLRCSTPVMQARRGLAWEAQAQTTARSTVAHAGGAQWGVAEESQASDYKVASMPFDAMASNAISLIGFTGRDLQLKRLQSGRTVGTVTLAVNHKAGETSWFVLFPRSAVEGAAPSKCTNSTHDGLVCPGMTLTSGGPWLSESQNKFPKDPEFASRANSALLAGPTVRASSKPD